MARLEVEIVANTQGADRVVRSLKQIREASGKTGTSLAGVTKQAQTQNTTLTATSATLTGTANAYNGLTVAATRQGVALQTNIAANTKLTTSLQTSAAATTRQAGSTKFLTATLAKLGAVATTTGTALSRLAASGGAAALNLLRQSAASATKAITILNAALTGVVALAGGVAAAFALGIGSGVKSAVELEKTFSRIEGLVGIAADEVEAFKAPLLEIGRATAKGPNELAEALFFVTSAGFEGQEALDILAASAKAAAAGLGETKTVADAVTSAVNAYGVENLKASEATDILVATVREGKAEADSIAGALGQILPAASELGVEFNELGGTIAALTRIGLGADQGATALGATLAAIQKPGNDAEAALEGVRLSGAKLRDVVANQGLLPALQLLQERFEGNDEALTRVFPNIRALRAVLPLVGRNAGDVAGIFQNVKESVSSTDAAFQAYTKTTAFSLAEANVALQISLQKIGEDLLPVVAKAFVTLAESVEGTIKVFETLGEIVAKVLNGADDPYDRAIERQAELKQALADLEFGPQFLAGIDEFGNAIFERGTELSEFDKVTKAAVNRFTGLADIDLSGLNYDEQVEAIRAALNAQSELVESLEKEDLQRQRLAAATREQNDALEETVETATKGGTASALIDQDRLDEGKESLAELRGEVALLSADLTNLGELGQAGTGLAEDAAIADEIFGSLQGQVSITKDEVLKLVQAKRDLEGSIAAVNQRFQEQDAAVETVEEIRRSIERTTELIAAAGEGEVSLFQTEALQQAREIFQALPADTELTVEAIQSLILAEQALNDQLDETQEKFRNSNDVIEQFSIQAARNIQTAFADFLFDPFSDGLDGMVFKFAESLKKIAAEILANQILTQFFKSIQGFGGPLGGFASSALDVLGGNQFGGNVFAGQPGIINENLSARGEVFVPSTDGRIVTKQQAREAVGGGNQEPPQVNITNVSDPADAVAALNTNAGQQAILNTIQQNPSAIKRALT